MITDVIVKIKRVSYSQFSTWFTCPFKFQNDYILKKKKFEDSLNMSCGTAIHEAIQLYLKTLFWKTEKQAESINLSKYFIWAFKWEVNTKKIPHTPEELDEFIQDGIAMLGEFTDPVNRRRYFPREKYELLGIETEINEAIFNKLNVVGFLDIVLKEKLSGDIKIVDFKTSTRGWSLNEQEDFTKLAQLRLYKALYSKKCKIPLNKIKVEFFILKRKLYDATKSKYPQTRLKVFSPVAYKADIDETLNEFSKFVNSCFTINGEHIVNKEYEKFPSIKACKYCQYAKDGTCDKKKSTVKLN